MEKKNGDSTYERERKGEREIGEMATEMKKGKKYESSQSARQAALPEVQTYAACLSSLLLKQSAVASGQFHAHALAG